MLLVATHVNYQNAWQLLKSKLVEANFPLSKVILVVAGDIKESCTFEKDGVIRITVPYNFYELTAVYGLHRFIDHPAIHAESYLLIHDTCAVTPDFYQKYTAFLTTMKTKDLDVYHAINDMRLNLAGLSYDFVKTHGAVYGINGDKPAAWDAEHGGALSFRSLVPKEKLGSAEDPLIFQQGIDVYGSKLIRHPVYLPSLGLIKFVANNDAHVNPSWQHRVYP